MLNFEYGVNTGNRFLQFVDHDEDPEAFIAAQTKEEPIKKSSSSKDSKQTTKKVTSKITTTTTTVVTSTKTNKENQTTKPSNVDQRRQPSATTATVFSDNNQQARGDSARGTRGGLRRGGAGPSYEGAGRGRSQRFNKFDGQAPSSSNEQSSFDASGEGWSNEGASRGGRGRGGPRRGNFEGNRGVGGRGRGRGGRGTFNNRNFEEGSQQETGGWQQNSESNFESNRSQSNRDFDQEVSPQERPFEPDMTRRNNRGNFRGRPYHSNRSYSDREGGEISQEDYRANRRLHDRQPRTNVSSVKPIEKKDGEGAYNWGNPTENPEEHPISDEITETTVGQSATGTKDWAQQVDEAEKQMTLEEYKKQIEAKKRAHQEKIPQFNTRTAGEGEDPKSWEKPAQVYRKKNNSDESEGDEEGEEESGAEENQSEEDMEEEQYSGKKKIIVIPLHFKPIDMPRGSSRGGQRRSGNPRFRQNRDEQGTPTSPSQDQQGIASQPSEDAPTNYRGGQRGGRGEFRRSYGNSARGSRQGRSHNDPNAPALDNPDDFPTLPKQYSHDK